MPKGLIAGFLLIVVAVMAGGYWYMSSGSTMGDQFIIADYKDRQLVSLGKGLYATNCASCHGAKLEGQPNWREPLADGTLPAPPHDETGHTWHHPDMMLFGITKYGGQASAPAGFLSAMPAFEAVLSDDEIIAVLAYIKSSWPKAAQDRQAAGNEKLKQQMGYN